MTPTRISPVLTKGFDSERTLGADVVSLQAHGAPAVLAPCPPVVVDVADIVAIHVTTFNGTDPLSDPGAAVAEPVATVILPAYNEAEALPEVLKSLFAVLDNRYEVIVVDDASKDATAAIASSFPCRLLRHEVNQGKGAAVRTGLREARGRFVIVMDADNTYPADAIPHMVELSEEYDFVRGIRSERDASMPLINKMGNKFFDSVLELVHGLEGGDYLTGLYGLRREALNQMRFTADRFDLEVEIGIKARAHRLRSISFPFKYGERLGEKKLNPLWDGWAILRRTLSLSVLYNPGFAFFVPSVLVWAITAIVALALGNGFPAAQYGAMGFSSLSMHSLIMAALGGIVGFQLIVFGMAAGLYSVECGVPPQPWLLMLANRRARGRITRFGMLCSLVGLVILGALFSQWALGGSLGDTRLAVAAGILPLLGIQAMLAMSFISIFAGRFDKLVGPSNENNAVTFDLRSAETTRS